MPRRVPPLTDAKVKNTRATDKEQVLSDGNGLQIRVLPNGTKSWRYVYTNPASRKRASISLGTYPTTTLATARILVQELRELVAQRIDPKAHKLQERKKEEAKTKHTLIYVTRDWIETKKAVVTLEYANDIMRSLELHVFPKLGTTPISTINAQEVIDTLKVVESKGSLETVKRLSQRLNEIMIFAMNSGLINSNPLTGIKVAFRKPKKEHMKALSPEELPELMYTLSNASIKFPTRCLIEFQLHTMVRPNEAAGARWCEIDFTNNVWTIPAERMKKRKEHRIPLTSKVLAILEIMRAISKYSEYIFPSIKDSLKPMHSQTANMALKRMGFSGRLVSHGLRSIASSTLNEHGHDYYLIEAALAHLVGSDTHRAYSRTDYLERRRDLMDWWSEHIVMLSAQNVSVSELKRSE